MTKEINDGEPGMTPTRNGDGQPSRCFAADTGETMGGGRILALPGIPVAQFTSGSYSAPAFPSWLRRFFADLS